MWAYVVDVGEGQRGQRRTLHDGRWPEDGGSRAIRLGEPWYDGGARRRKWMWRTDEVEDSGSLGAKAPHDVGLSIGTEVTC